MPAADALLAVQASQLQRLNYRMRGMDAYLPARLPPTCLLAGWGIETNMPLLYLPLRHMDLPQQLPAGRCTRGMGAGNCGALVGSAAHHRRWVGKQAATCRWLMGWLSMHK